jgi:hypothetical protein
MQYDMSAFLSACVDRYKELTSVSKVRDAPTPFVDAQCPDTPTVGKIIPEDHASAPGGEVLTANPTPGRHGSIASRVLMKILYAARMARPDLLKAVNSLACMVTKWDLACDAKLLRLVGYVQMTTKHCQIAWVGDPLEAWSLHLYADADFAGCSDTCAKHHGCLLVRTRP